MGQEVHFMRCPCGKRDFGDEHAAEKAMGRARTRRNRIADKAGSRRGVKRENRIYTCDFDGVHLTEQSRREHQTLAERLYNDYVMEVAA